MWKQNKISRCINFYEQLIKVGKNICPTRGKIEHSKHWQIIFWQMPKITKRLVWHQWRGQHASKAHEIIPKGSAKPKAPSLKSPLHSSPSLSQPSPSMLAEEISKYKSFAPNVPFGSARGYLWADVNTLIIPSMPFSSHVPNTF